MDKQELKQMSGIEVLRLLVSNFNGCREGAIDRFSTAQLVKIYEAWLLSEWDIAPDCWTQRQLKEALKGRPPTFDDQERPTYDPKPKRAKKVTRQPAF